MRKLSNEARKELEAVAAMPDSEIRDWRGKTLERRSVSPSADGSADRRTVGVTY
jgi:hypothetical protein